MDFDTLPLSLIDGLNTVGVVLILAWLLVTGRLVTRREYDRTITWITADRDYWRAAAETDRKTLELAVRSNAEQVELGRTTVHLLRAMQDRAANSRETTT